jgi:YigZ family protein
MSYRSVFSPGESSFVIEKSRFIGRCAHVENEEKAAEFVREIKRKEALATHNCWAYVADSRGNLLRFSDDGEPSGTAGMPILEVLRQQRLFQSAIVVTRYFGGIKLGAGGLVRAYTKAAADALSAAEIRVWLPCVRFRIEMDYTLFHLFEKRFSSFALTEEGREYGSGVALELSLKEELFDEFCAAYSDFTHGKGQLQVTEKAVRPFPEHV